MFTVWSYLPCCIDRAWQTLYYMYLISIVTFFLMIFDPFFKKGQKLITKLEILKMSIKSDIALEVTTCEQVTMILIQFIPGMCK